MEYEESKLAVLHSQHTYYDAIRARVDGDDRDAEGVSSELHLKRVFMLLTNGLNDSGSELQNFKPALAPTDQEMAATAKGMM